MSEMNMVTILIIIVIINDIDSGIVGRVLVCLKMRADIFKMITVAIVLIIMNITMIIGMINTHHVLPMDTFPPVLPRHPHQAPVTIPGTSTELEEGFPTRMLSRRNHGTVC